MVDEKDSTRLKLCFDIRLEGSSTIHISPVAIDMKIWEFPNMVFFICSDGYVMEKSTDTIKYSIYRLTVPTYVDDKMRKKTYTFTFTDDSTRYEFLKKLKHNLHEFAKSGFFGHNPTSHVLTYNNFWFVY